ncbi:MAG: response regulator [Anaerolineales bacterium]
MTAKILVAEDQADLREMIAATLSLSGYEVVAAEDGKQAYDHAQRANPDLIILDLEMPGMSGSQVCKQLKASQRFSDTPIVIISAHGDAAKIEESLQAGARDYMRKPFGMQQLTQRVTELLTEA